MVPIVTHNNQALPYSVCIYFFLVVFVQLTLV